MSNTENTSTPAATTSAPAQAPVAKPATPAPQTATVPAAPKPATTTAPATVTPPVTEPAEEEVTKVDELSLLKSRASLMGIEFSNNIGIDTLKAKIAAKAAGDTEANTQTTDADDDGDTLVSASTPKAPERVKTLRELLLEDAMKLVRLRITNLDPKKASIPGEIMTVANEYIGTVRKYIPFGEYTDGGYHVPNCLYELLKERRFLSIKIRKGSKGERIVEQQMAKEFALEVLDPLTPEELAALAAKQHATRSTVDE